MRPMAVMSNMAVILLRITIVEVVVMNKNVLAMVLVMPATVL